MPEDKEHLDPSTPSSAWRHMIGIWNKITTLLAGTREMRNAGEDYLPIHENESSDAYNDRLQSATLLNMTALTLDSWVGRPFSDPPTRHEDIVEESDMDRWLEDIDMQGNDIGVFARNWFKEGLSKSFAHVLVDFPDIGDPSDRTLADDANDGVRPFFSMIAPENLIFAEATTIEGKEVLTHVRISEQEIVRRGFSEMVINRIRVFDLVLPGMDPAFVVPDIQLTMDDDSRMAFVDSNEPGVFVSTWRHDPDAKSGEDEWVLDELPRRIGATRIPIVTFYANRTGLMQGKPPVEDLADVNIRHWQSQSDQINVLTVARFPILSATGVDVEDDILEIGPKRLLASSKENAKFGYVEHTGAAIEAGRQDLVDLEEQMGHYGADFLKRQPGNQTATARALDSAEATSPLQDAVVRFNDALQQAIELFAMWVPTLEVPKPAVLIPVDFGPEEIVQGDLDSLSNARKLRDISRTSYLSELRRRGVLGDEFDIDANDQELESETAEFSEGAPSDGADIDPLAEE